MRFEDERYVRLYTKNTPGWCVVPWQARALLPLVLRVLDRAGLVELGDDGLEALSALVMLPIDVVEVGLRAWIARGTFELRGSTLIMPKFLDAQEATASNAQRSREKRARARDRARSGVSDTIRVGPDTARHTATGGAHASEIGAAPRMASAVRQAPSVVENDTAGVASDTIRVGPDTARHTATLLAVPSHTVQSRADGDHPPLASLAPPKGCASSKRGSRIPENWRPSPEALAFCEASGVDAAACVPEFVDHWKSVPGAKGVKLDWNATFRNRVRSLLAGGRAPMLPSMPEQTHLTDAPVVDADGVAKVHAILRETSAALSRPLAERKAVTT